MEITVQPDGAGTVEAILPRKNRLVRPAVANLDRLFIVASVCDPSPNMLVIDKMTAAAVSKDIEPVIVVSKTDLENGGSLKEIYDTAGIRTVCFSAEDNSGADEIKSLLTGCVAAFTGNSGVGKSTLLNSVFPHLSLQTSHTSQKLGRGRHTTRTVELFPTDGGYVADTPGFSSVDMQRYELIKKKTCRTVFQNSAIIWAAASLPPARTLKKRAAPSGRLWRTGKSIRHALQAMSPCMKK